MLDVGDAADVVSQPMSSQGEGADIRGWKLGFSERTALLTFAVLAAALVNGSIALYLWRSHELEHAAARHETAQAAASLASSVYAIFESLDGALIDLADRLWASERNLANPTPSAQIFDEVAKTRRLIYRLEKADARGIVTGYSPLGSVPALDLGDREHFINLRDNPGAAFVISAVSRGRRYGQEFIAVSRALRASDGAFAGIVIASIRKIGRAHV